MSGVKHEKISNEGPECSGVLTFTGGVTRLKYYNGSSWVAVPASDIKYYDGASWTVKPLKFWTGSAWEDV